MMAHPLREQLLEFAVYEGRAAEITCTGGTFEDAEVRVDGMDVVGYQVYSSTAGVTDDYAVMDFDLGVRGTVFETAEGVYSGAFGFR